jgi:hypothetical protein
VIFRSIFRGRLLYAAPGWLLEETAAQVVTAIVPGAQTLQPVTPRANMMREVAASREQTALVPWHTNRVVWLTPFNAAHAIGHSAWALHPKRSGHYSGRRRARHRPPVQSVANRLGTLAPATTLVGVNTQAARATLTIRTFGASCGAGLRSRRSDRGRPGHRR